MSNRSMCFNRGSRLAEVKRAGRPMCSGRASRLADGSRASDWSRRVIFRPRSRIFKLLPTSDFLSSDPPRPSELVFPSTPRTFLPFRASASAFGFGASSTRSLGRSAPRSAPRPALPQREVENFLEVFERGKSLFI